MIEATMANAESMLDALTRAGLGTAEMTTAEEVLAHEITIFKDRFRIDVQTSTPGLDFETAWERRVTMEYQGKPLAVKI